MIGAAPGPRVLMVLKRAGGLGGMQLRTRRVCTALRRAGLPLRLLTRAPQPGASPPGWTRRLESVYLPAAHHLDFARRVHAHLCRHREEYDLVHVQGFDWELFAALAARRATGRPVVAQPTITGRHTHLELFARLTRLAPPLKRLWERADLWVAMSEQAAADIARLGIDPARVRAVPGGVNTRRFRPLEAADRAAARSVIGVPPGDVLVCTASRLQPHKRVDALIRLFLELLPRFPAARLWVLGQGEEEARLRTLAAASDRIRVWGGVPPRRVVTLLRASDVFVLLSLREGLSNALMEAMACGLACVAADVSGTTDVLEHGETGLVVPPGDDAAARDALSRLLEDAALRSRLGGRAAEAIRQRHSFDRSIERLIDLYREAVGGGGEDAR